MIRNRGIFYNWIHRLKVKDKINFSWAIWRLIVNLECYFPIFPQCAVKKKNKPKQKTAGHALFLVDGKYFSFTLREEELMRLALPSSSSFRWKMTALRECMALKIKSCHNLSQSEVKSKPICDNLFCSPFTIPCIYFLCSLIGSLHLQLIIVVIYSILSSTTCDKTVLDWHERHYMIHSHSLSMLSKPTI